LESAGTPVDEAFIERILRIPVKKAPRRSALVPGRRRRGPSEKQRFWLVSLRGDASYPGNEELVESVTAEIQSKLSAKAGLVDWFWWGSSARFPVQARVGDVVFECYRPRAQMASSRGVRVYGHGRIARIFQGQGSSLKTFHCSWPAAHERTALSWGDFSRLAKRAGVTRMITYKSNIELSEQEAVALLDLWPRQFRG